MAGRGRLSLLRRSLRVRHSKLRRRSHRPPCQPIGPFQADRVLLSDDDAADAPPHGVEGGVELEQQQPSSLELGARRPGPEAPSLANRVQVLGARLPERPPVEKWMRDAKG